VGTASAPHLFVQAGKSKGATTAPILAEHDRPKDVAGEVQSSVDGHHADAQGDSEDR
jgi:hypothetical protein